MAALGTLCLRALESTSEAFWAILLISFWVLTASAELTPLVSALNSWSESLWDCLISELTFDV